jgi:hypothetical protein
MIMILMRDTINSLSHVILQVGYSAPTQSGIVDEVGLSISGVCNLNKLSLEEISFSLSK